VKKRSRLPMWQRNFAEDARITLSPQSGPGCFGKAQTLGEEQRKRDLEAVSGRSFAVEDEYAGLSRQVRIRCLRRFDQDHTRGRQTFVKIRNGHVMIEEIDDAFQV
jgi:hypothetical protein